MAPQKTRGWLWMFVPIFCEIILGVIAWRVFGGSGALFRVAIALLCVTTYAEFLSFVRWHHIAVPFRRHLFAEVQGLRADLIRYTGRINENSATKIATVDAITRLLDKAEAIAKRGAPEPEAAAEHCSANFSDDRFERRWIWTQGLELAGWHMLLDARPSFAWLMPAAEAEARLRSASSSVRTLGTAGNALAATIDEELKKTEHNGSAVQALLFEALRLESEHEKEEEGSLLTWHNKVLFLLLLALGLIVGAAGVNWPILLVFGAIGGLVSRLLRGLEGDEGEVPCRFSTYWTSFFLSPVVGALGGWLSVLLVAFLVQINLLGEDLYPFVGKGPLANRGWSELDFIKAGGIAFLAGFSERMLKGLITSGEAKFSGDRESIEESSS